MSNKTFHF